MRGINDPVHGRQHTNRHESRELGPAPVLETANDPGSSPIVQTGRGRPAEMGKPAFALRTSRGSSLLDDSRNPAPRAQGQWNRRHPRRAQVADWRPISGDRYATRGAPARDYRVAEIGQPTGEPSDSPDRHPADPRFRPPLPPPTWCPSSPLECSPHRTSARGSARPAGRASRDRPCGHSSELRRPGPLRASPAVHEIEGEPYSHVAER